MSGAVFGVGEGFDLYSTYSYQSDIKRDCYVFLPTVWIILGHVRGSISIDDCFGIDNINKN